jgi:hypothetical protein
VELYLHSRKSSWRRTWLNTGTTSTLIRQPLAEKQVTDKFALLNTETINAYVLHTYVGLDYIYCNMKWCLHKGKKVKLSLCF